MTDRYLSEVLPALFVVLCSVLGVLYAFALPPLQVPDEFAHLYRAWGLSQGHFVAPPLTPVPASIVRLTTRFPPHIEAVRKVSADELLSLTSEPLEPKQLIPVPNQGMNVNTWFPYVPSATVILITRLSSTPPIVILYLARLANLTGYIVLVWGALRVAPACRFLIFTIALMPMVIHQAAGLSWDSIGFGIAFLFCAMVIRYASSAGIRPRKWDYIALVGLVIVVSLCKVDFALLPLLLLIPTARFGSLKRRLAFLVICVAVAAVTSIIWQYENRVNLQMFAEVAQQGQVRFPENAWYWYYNTGYLVNALLRSVVQIGPNMTVPQLVGTFGWLFVILPRWAVITYLILLFCAGFAGLSQLRLAWFDRAVACCVALLGAGGCILAMWMTTPEFYIRDVILHNIGTLYGIQGRHFIPFVFPALLAFSNTRIRVRLLWLLSFAIAVIVLVNATGLILIERSYY